MDKDTFSTVALIGLLLAIIVSALYVRKANELVVARTDLNQVVGSIFDQFLDVSTPTATPQPTPKPTTSQKASWQIDPVPKVAAEIEAKFQSDLIAQNLSTVTYINDQLWWRSEKEGYRILVTGAKVFGAQVPTTQVAREKAPQDNKSEHPALTHPLLAKVSKEISTQLDALGFKRDHFKNCPLSEAYDPFNNCVYYYTRDQVKCSLIAGYGRLDKQPDQLPYLRLELACSSDYDSAYASAAPYLLTLSLINPDWYVPDMAVYSSRTVDNWTRVSFGQQYGIFTQLDDGYRLLTGGYYPPSCDLVTSENVPIEIYQECR
jgi:hypothetical protein